MSNDMITAIIFACGFFTLVIAIMIYSVRDHKWINEKIEHRTFILHDRINDLEKRIEELEKRNRGKRK